MYLAILFFGKNIGFIGIGILGAISHNISQLIVFWFFSGKNDFLFGAISYIVFFSAAFGILVGYLAYLLDRRNTLSTVQKVA